MDNSDTAAVSYLPEIVKWSAILSLAGALAVIFSGYGYQWNWWSYRIGLSLLIPLGTVVSVVSGFISFIAYLRAGTAVQVKVAFAFPALFVALLVAGNGIYWYSEIQTGYPPIHDITTDTEDPPEFDAILELRHQAANPAKYPGDETAAQQKAFYHSLETVSTPLSYEEAYRRALETARSMPWTLVSESEEKGKIEAYHKLPWYGFIDDIVIRVRETGDGTEIDVRSKSRVGRSDLGVNARRITEYLHRLNLD